MTETRYSDIRLLQIHRFGKGFSDSAYPQFRGLVAIAELGNARSKVAISWRQLFEHGFHFARDKKESISHVEVARTTGETSIKDEVRRFEIFRKSPRSVRQDMSAVRPSRHRRNTASVGL
ncbi:hypothetical protein ATY77_19720 [Rhizobium sp. R634]|nr:hypothetical protein ATY77_19720 [Rhizobium sp. R634]